MNCVVVDTSIASAVADSSAALADAEVTSRMFITACKAVNYRVIPTQLVTF